MKIVACTCFWAKSVLLSEAQRAGFCAKTCQATILQVICLQITILAHFASKMGSSSRPSSAAWGKPLTQRSWVGVLPQGRSPRSSIKYNYIDMRIEVRDPIIDMINILCHDLG